MRIKSAKYPKTLEKKVSTLEEWFLCADDYVLNTFHGRKASQKKLQKLQKNIPKEILGAFFYKRGYILNPDLPSSFFKDFIKLDYSEDLIGDYIFLGDIPGSWVKLEIPEKFMPQIQEIKKKGAWEYLSNSYFIISIDLDCLYLEVPSAVAYIDVEAFLHEYQDCKEVLRGVKP